MDKLDKRIKQLLFIFLIAFLGLVINLTYIQIFAAEKIIAHPKNTRFLARELSKERGRIVTSDGVVIARSERVEGRDRRYRRIYPQGETMAAFTGFYHPKYGRSGLELAFNKELLDEGKIGNFNDLLDRIREEKRPGNDVILTIDSRIQKEAVLALGERRGAIVVLEAQSGKVLALATSPSYNPNNLEKNWDVFSKDPSSPLMNRATQGTYPPGSSFKIVTAAAALESQIASPEETYSAPGIYPVYGSQVTNFKEIDYGTLSLAEAFTKSVNTVFAQVGLDLKAQGLVSFAKKFGLNKKIPFVLPVKTSTIPSPSKMDLVDVAWSAAGQGEILVTPLQMALVTQAIANKGEIMRPYIVREIKNSEGKTLESFGPRTWKKPISRKTAQELNDLMVQVVEEGTGTQAQIEGVRVAGKTGTAEIKDGEPHAWFVGFAPANNPQVIVAVVLEKAGTGGSQAAPLARSVLEQALGE